MKQVKMILIWYEALSGLHDAEKLVLFKVHNYEDSVFSIYGAMTVVFSCNLPGNRLGSLKESDFVGSTA